MKQIYKNEFFTIFTDTENLNNQQKIFDALNDNLARIMSFFEIEKISNIESQVKIIKEIWQ